MKKKLLLVMFGVGLYGAVYADGATQTVQVYNSGEQTLTLDENPVSFAWDDTSSTFIPPVVDLGTCIKDKAILHNGSCEFTLTAQENPELTSKQTGTVTVVGKGEHGDPIQYILSVDVKPIPKTAKSYVIWVSNASGTGNLSSWSGVPAELTTTADRANWICSHDSIAGFPANYDQTQAKAWISDDTVNAWENVFGEDTPNTATANGAPTYRLDGTTIVSNDGLSLVAAPDPASWDANRTTSKLVNPIEDATVKVATGTSVPQAGWRENAYYQVYPAGQKISMNCSNWTYSKQNNDLQGYFGSSEFDTYSWAGTVSKFCNAINPVNDKYEPFHLYCVAPEK